MSTESSSGNAPRPILLHVPGGAPPSNPLWKSKSLWAAAAIMILGAVLWAAEPAPARQGAARTGQGVPGISSFAGGSAAASVENSPQPSAVSPAVFRFGASYMCGFFLGWALRKSIKLAMLFGGAMVTLLVLAKHFGMAELNWQAIEAQLAQGMAWIQGEAVALKDIIMGYLPSSVAGGAGLWRGARRG